MAQCRSWATTDGTSLQHICACVTANYVSTRKKSILTRLIQAYNTQLVTLILYTMSYVNVIILIRSYPIVIDKIFIIILIISSITTCIILHMIIYIEWTYTKFTWSSSCLKMTLLSLLLQHVHTTCICSTHLTMSI